MTQSQQILNHLREHGSITPMTALAEYGCMRLGARIYDLKACGHQINTTIENKVGRNGKQVRYARYWMKTEE